MRDHRTEHAQMPTATEAAVESIQAEPADRTRYTNEGQLPPFEHGTEMAAVSPSDRAYGAHGHALSAEGVVMEREEQADGNVIEEASRRYGIPAVDILAVITQESRGKATANAGASQKDHGAHAASGLMQVTAATWKTTQHAHPELAHYAFESYRYDRRVNILVGTAALADKKRALETMGVPASAVTGALTTMAFNAGEGIVADAYHRAVHAGVRDPGGECLRAEFLMPAIAKYPSVYSYYLTGGGKKANPQRSVQRAIELKYHEISKYPIAVEQLVAEANEHQMADDDFDGPRLPNSADRELA